MSLDIASVTFDQSVYNPGDTITCTVNYTSTDTTGTPNASYAVNVTVEDGVSTANLDSAEFTVAGSGVVVVPTQVSVTDNRNPPGAWTEVSNVLSGTEAPFTGVAVFTSVA